MEPESPVFCSLSAGDYRKRIEFIRTLDRHLKRVRRSDNSIVLTYGRDAGGGVRKLVELEKACCAFLWFDVKDDGDEIELSITAPDSAREYARFLFEEFLPSATRAAVC
jgi:hypothetical protein